MKDNFDKFCKDHAFTNQIKDEIIRFINEEQESEHQKFVKLFDKQRFQIQALEEEVEKLKTIINTK